MTSGTGGSLEGELNPKGIRKGFMGGGQLYFSRSRELHRILLDSKEAFLPIMAQRRELSSPDH